MVDEERPRELDDRGEPPERGGREERDDRSPRGGYGFERRSGGFDRPGGFQRRDDVRGRRPGGRPGARPGGRDFDRPRRDFDRPRRDFGGQRDAGARGGRYQGREGSFDRPASHQRDGAPTDRPDRGQRQPDAGRPRAAFDRPQRPWERRPERPWERREPRPGQRPPHRQQAPRPDAVPRTDLVSDDEDLVAGRRPVAEAFASRREARRLLVVPERRAALESLVLHATTMRLPIVEVEGGTLTSLTGFDGHQGVALAVGRRAPATVTDMIALAQAREEDPFILILDSLEDPQNLGTLLRSAEACGVHGVVYPIRHAAPLTAAAIKSSAGATEHLLLAPVESLAGTLADLRAAGMRLVGADEGASLRFSEADLRGPLALVVGSEERGISGALRRRLDMTVRIPMRGRVASLNAAVAGSVLLFAAAEQRGSPEAGDRPDLAPAHPPAKRRQRTAAPAEEPPALAAAEEGLASEAGDTAVSSGPAESAPSGDSAIGADASDDGGLLPGGPGDLADQGEPPSD